MNINYTLTCFSFNVLKFRNLKHKRIKAIQNMMKGMENTMLVIGTLRNTSVPAPEIIAISTDTIPPRAKIGLE